ncbi:IDEAL domain-containing protein [Brevibacillus humidisoli]|uniref:IDEAL domain-containing protein n=1 Tax=Brevibacillus humidisoli TaxID=2895522 RepID=UPI001E2E6A7E|nr:IDEAL domain-containing protein [Brevibacillus humidisoli]UFJ42761.1 IDEAL domain-containing protein [Brevibacillus humidisoli]
MERPNYMQQQNVLAGLLSEIAIDREMRSLRKKALYEEIDQALAMKNKESFLRLTAELREIMTYEQSETG